MPRSHWSPNWAAGTAFLVVLAALLISLATVVPAMCGFDYDCRARPDPQITITVRLPPAPQPHANG